MKTHELMTPKVCCVRPSDTLTAAAELMRDYDIGSVPVCGDDDKLTGYLTDRDITIRAIAKGLDPNSTRVSEVMTHSIIFTYEDQEIGELIDVMEQNQIRRIPVLSRENRLVGIVSLGDVALGAETDLSGATLRKVSEPGKSPSRLPAGE